MHTTQAKKEQMNKATNGIIAATSDLAAVIKKNSFDANFLKAIAESEATGGVGMTGGATGAGPRRR